MNQNIADLQLEEDEREALLRGQSLASRGGNNAPASSLQEADVTGPSGLEQQQYQYSAASMQNLQELSDYTKAVYDGSYAPETPSDALWYDKSLREETKPPMSKLGSLWDATGKAAAHGTGRMLEETAQFGYDVLNFFDDFLGIDALDNDYKVESKIVKSLEPQTRAGQFVSPVTQFLTGFIGAGKILKATSIANKLGRMGKAGKYGTTLIQGAMADAVVQDPTDARLSNLIQAFPALQNPITEYLSADENDGSFEGRLKNAIEGLGIGLATDAMFKGLKSIKWARKASAGDMIDPAVVRKAEAARKEADKAARRAVGNLDGGTAEAASGTAADQPKAAIDAIITRTEPKGLTVSVRNTDEALQAIGDMLRGITESGKVRGLDYTRAMDEITHLVGQVADGALEDSQISKRVTKLLKDLNITDTKVGNIDAKEYLENAIKRVTADAEPKAFIPTNSVMNTEKLGNRHYSQLIDALEDTASFKRTSIEKTTVSNAQVRMDATRIVRKWFKDGVDMKDINNLFDRFANDAHNLNEKIYLVESAVVEAAENVKTVVEHLRTIPKEEAASFLNKEARRLLEQWAKIAHCYDTLSTGIARGLQAAKMTAKAGDLPGLGDMLTRMKEHGGIQRVIGSMSADDVLQTMNRIATAPDHMRTMRLLIPNTGTGKFMAMANEYWINSILSGPVTHLVNAMSNAFKLGVMMPVEAIVGSSWQYMRNGTFDKQLWNEGAKAYAGMAHAFSDAFQMAKLSFKLGHNILSPTNTVIENSVRMISADVAGVSMNSAAGQAIEAVGKLVNLPTRFLMSTDEFFKQLAARSKIFTDLYSTAEVKYAKGMLKGTKEEAIQRYINEGFEKQLVDVLNDQGGVLVKGGSTSNSGALANATEATWTTDLAKDSFGKWVQEGAYRFPMFRRVVPFVRTPTNILKDAIAHTPGLANCTKAYREAIEAGGAEAAKANGKVIFGSMVWGMGLMAAYNGVLTGGGPKNKSARAMLLETGWRPYSLKIGDKYVSYARVEPFASLLGTMGDFAELISAYEADGGEQYSADSVMGLGGAAVFSLFYNLSSKTYAQGISNLMAAIMDKNKLQSFVKDHALSHIPALLTQSRKLIDPEIKEVQGLIEEAKTRIPWLSKDAPTRYSWLTGKPVLVHGGMMSGISPVVWDSVEYNEVAEEMTQFPRAITSPAKDIGGVKLTSEQLSDYQRLHGTVRIHGKNLMDALKATINSPQYDRARDINKNTKEQMDDTRFIMLQNVVLDYRLKARQELLKIHPDLRDKLKAGRSRGEIHEMVKKSYGYESRAETAKARREEVFAAIKGF